MRHLSRLVVLLLAGCGGGLSSTPTQDSRDGTVPEGIMYRLPATELAVSVIWTLKTCPTLTSANGVSGSLVTEIDVKAKASVIEGEAYHLNFDDSASTDSEFEIKFLAGTARIASINGTVTDQTGQIIGDVLKGVVSLAATAASLGVLRTTTTPSSGPCTAEAEAATKEAADLEGRLTAARKEDAERFGPAQARVDAAKSAVTSARQQLNDIRSVASDRAVAELTRRLDASVAEQAVAERALAQLGTPKAPAIERELTQLRKNKLSITTTHTWRPGLDLGQSSRRSTIPVGNPDPKDLWIFDVRLPAASVHGRWLSDHGICSVATRSFVTTGDVASTPLCGGPTPDKLSLDATRLDEFYVLEETARLAIAGPTGEPLHASRAPNRGVFGGVLVRQPAQVVLRSCRGDCGVGGQVIERSTLPIAQAGPATLIPLTVGTFGSRTVALQLDSEGAVSTVSTKRGAPGAAAAQTFAASAASINSGIDTILKALRDRATSARDDEKAILEAEIARLEGEKKRLDALAALENAGRSSPAAQQQASLRAEVAVAEEERKLYDTLRQRDEARRQFEAGGGTR